MNKKEEYEIYVWKGAGVLQDYTSGMIVAVARNLDEALDAIEKEESFSMNSFPAKDYEAYPINKANAWMVWGGG